MTRAARVDRGLNGANRYRPCASVKQVTAVAKAVVIVQAILIGVP
jgi:hypothetical protein